MAFHVAFHNRDDNAKNFAYVMNPDGSGHLSPPFDLTYSPGPGGEHTTSVLGEDHLPTSDHLLKLAERTGIDRTTAQLTLQEIEDGKTFMKDLLLQFQVKDHPCCQLL